jgi:hypothetical protein
LQKIITEGTRTRLPLPATILAARLGGMATYNHQKHAISGAKIKDVLVYDLIVQCPH